VPEFLSKIRGPARYDLGRRGDVGGPAELNELARMLLTWEPADLQDPHRALRLVREANDQTGYMNPHYLDTLSLALHRTDDTTGAVAYQRKALALAPVSSRANYQQALARFEAELEDRPE
jgi:hypothetical protein